MSATFPRVARVPLLALGIALSTFAAAQSAPQAPASPALGPAFATKTAAYVPVMFDEIPGWEDERFDEIHASFSSNCKAMRRRSAWAPICSKLARLPRTDAALRGFLHEEFYAYQMLTSGRSATGKLTGYFEPLIAGSLHRQGAFKYPVYGMPQDMYLVDSRTVAGQSSRWLRIADGRMLGAEAGAAGARNYRIDLSGGSAGTRDKRYRVRIEGDTIRPYYTRKQIDATGIDAPVLAWVADPFKLYSMQIQGSGKIQLKDGGLVRLAYAEQNGHPFLPQATRGDADAMLLAIKARALQEPPTVDVPGGTRSAGATRGGSDACSGCQVARIVAALGGGGTGKAGASARPASAKPAMAKPAPRRPAPRPANLPVIEPAAEPIAVASADVEAMIQLLLAAPVADEGHAAPEEDPIAAITGNVSPGGQAKGAGRIDVIEFEARPAAASRSDRRSAAAPRCRPPAYTILRSCSSAASATARKARSVRWACR